MLTSAQKKWEIAQWIAYLKDKEIPVLESSRDKLSALIRERKEGLAPKEMVGLIFQDPYLALKLLRRAEERRTSRMGHETTTPLASVLQTGLDDLTNVVLNGPVANAALPGSGVKQCQHRAIMAADIAHQWASMRTDISPDEVAMAALLSECGELLLWHFAPELPQQAMDELLSGRALRTIQAQQQTCGFSFKVMTLELVQAWKLPNLIALLIKGSETPRANLARLATDTARHIETNPENPAIPADIVNINEILKDASPHRLVSVLPISDQYKTFVLEQIAAHTVSMEPKK